MIRRKFFMLCLLRYCCDSTSSLLHLNRFVCFGFLDLCYINAPMGNPGLDLHHIIFKNKCRSAT